MEKIIRQECEKLGIIVGAVVQNGHKKVELTNAAGKSMKFVCAVSVSDSRAWLNVRAHLRRFAREQ